MDASRFFAARSIRAACTAGLVSSALAACGEEPAADDELHPARGDEVARITAAPQALENAQIATLDPATMHRVEIRKALQTEASCQFRYTTTGKPALAVGLGTGGEPTGGIVKLNGHLVPLQASAKRIEGSAGAAFELQSDPIRMTLTPVSSTADADSARTPAALLLEIGSSLRVGYHGYVGCLRGPAAAPPQR